MKYIVLGSLASGLLLYGMSLVYGATGSCTWMAIHAGHRRWLGEPHAAADRHGVHGRRRGLQARRGAVPHVAAGRLPGRADADHAVHQLGAQAGRVRHGVGACWRTAWARWRSSGSWLLAGLAALSLVIGNLMALAQTNLKRMLAYSTVSHVGFLLMGLAGGGEVGYAAALFYAISYAMMSAAAFGAIIVLSRQGFEADRIDDFKGLNARNPWMAGPGAVRDGLAGRRAAVPRLLGQAGGAARGGAGRDAVAGDRRRAVRGDRRVLLPARDQGDVLRR
jgi:NADH-quinone oxidoreductase subunit N